MGALDRINHVVVLMLENRSFDNLLGRLHAPSAQFNGLTGTETNPNPQGGTVQVWNQPGGTGEAVMTMPSPDPGEIWTDVNQQIFGTRLYPPPSPFVPMSGFVANYLDQATLPANRGVAYGPKPVMHYFTPDQVPAISALATAFAVSDAWFASAPCQTWPNRFFAHAATANGYENNEPVHFPYSMPTIFNRLEDAGIDWGIYFHDFPQALTLSELWPHLRRFHLYERFQLDVVTGNLPAYSFIEPRYFPDLTLPNDEHPPHDVTLGEQLVADVYNRLRGSDAWTQTLLVVTCDEHGGCYDHVLPPNAPPPSSTPTKPFNFDRFGVRVPAVFASPYIPAGSVVRAPADQQPFDHTSIISTLRRRFGLQAPLTLRDAAAPTLDLALTLDRPDNLGPPRIDALPFTPSLPEIARAQFQSLNDLQHSLMVAAAHLPTSAHEIGPHLALLTAGATIDVPANVTCQDARHLIKQRLSQLFGSL